MADDKKRQTIKSVMNEVNKTFGEGTIKPAADIAFAHKHRISTGIFKLDADIGGGIPKGRITMIVGDESAGKSTLCQNIAREFQQTCRSCGNKLGSCKLDCGVSKGHIVAYVDAEGSFDPAWAKKIGIEVEDLLLIQSEWAEQAADVINALIRTGELGLLIIDSVAMMTPGVEIEKSAEEMGVGLQARAINRLMRTAQSGFNSLGMDNPNKPAILLVNQFREKVGVMYGDPRTWPGGKGQNYAASILITMRAGKRIDAKGVPGGKDDHKVGVELFYSVEKNKTYPPFKKGGFQLFFDDTDFGYSAGEINNFEQILEVGDLYGLLGKGGAWFDLASVYGPTFANPDEKSGKFQGKDKVVAFLRQNPDKADIVRKRILQAIDAPPEPTDDGTDAAE